MSLEEALGHTAAVHICIFLVPTLSIIALCKNLFDSQFTTTTFRHLANGIVITFGFTIVAKM
jgi:hypothetical protein